MIVGRGALGTITKRNFLGSKLLFAFHLREKKTLLAAEPQQGSNLVKKILLIIGSICKTFTNQLLLAGFESWLGFLQLFLGWTSLLLLELGVFAASNQAGPASSPPCQPWLCALLISSFLSFSYGQNLKSHLFHQQQLLSIIPRYFILLLGIPSFLTAHSKPSSSL